MPSFLTVRSVHLSAMLAALGAATSAQTFVVDAAGGPGSNFTDLPQAIAAVPDGAVLEVRNGNYSPFTIANKSLSVLGGTQVNVLNGNAAVGPTSAGQTVELRGMRVPNGMIDLAQCSGRVLLSQCVTSFTTVVRAVDCAHVESRNGYYAGVQLTNSTMVEMSDALFRTNAATLIDLTNSSLQQVLTGSARLSSGATPQVRLAGSELRTMNCAFSGAGPSFVLAGSGTWRYDTMTQILPLAIDPGIAVEQGPMPAMTMSDTPLGGAASIDMFGPAGDLGVLVAGLPSLPYQRPELRDPVFLQAGTEIVLGVAPLPAGGVVTTQVAIPALPNMRGVRFAWQVVSLGLPSRAAISNPAVRTLW